MVGIFRTLSLGKVLGDGSVAERLPLQEQVDLPEGRSLQLLPSPALSQEIDDVLGGGWDGGPRKVQKVPLVPEQLAQVLHDLRVRQGVVGAPPRQMQDLPQRHAKRPDVALRRVLALGTDGGVRRVWLDQTFISIKNLSNNLYKSLQSIH